MMSHSDFGGSKTAPEHKDRWATPEWLYGVMHHQHGFVLDAAAEADNTKCDHFIGAAEDALTVDWHDRATQAGGTAVWVNPPYSRGMIGAFMSKAYEEAKKGLTIILLVPATPDASWWPCAIDCCATRITLITHGRVNFVSAGSGSIVRGNTKGSALVQFDATSKQMQFPEYRQVSRGQLMKQARELGINERDPKQPKPVKESTCPIAEAVHQVAGLTADDAEEVIDKIAGVKLRWDTEWDGPLLDDARIAEAVARIPLEVLTHGRRLKAHLRQLSKEAA